MAMGFGSRRGYRILQERWLSFQIVLGPGFIIRKQSGIPDIEIGREQVSQIQEKPSGIFVRTAEKRKYIHVWIFRPEIEPFSARKLSHFISYIQYPLSFPLTLRPAGGKDAEDGSSSCYSSQGSDRETEHS